MRVCAYARFDAGDGYLRFLKQYGIDDIVLSAASHPDARRRFGVPGAVPADACWDLESLVAVRDRCKAAGLAVAAIENPLPAWCCDRVLFGQPGRDQQIDNWIATLRSMGEAGIPVLGYNWMGNPPGATRYSRRTSFETEGRGGCLASSFDGTLAAAEPPFRDREYSREEMWAHYEYFIDAVLPAAEGAGVRLALHPDDPPVEQLGGVPRLFNGPEGFRRAMDIAGDRAASGLNFCLGNWTAMGTDITAAIRRFGGRGQIVYGHVQGVQGTVPSFQECFVDEADCDFLALFRQLADVGFDGVLLPGHSPHTVYENDAGALGLVYAAGYVKGLLRAVDRG